jgi:hypothetical protein
MTRYLTRREAAKYLTERGLPTTFSTLQKLACTGGGPLYQLYGNKTVYLPENLDGWAAAKMTPLRRSTSERELKRSSAICSEQPA